jgi:hypothetical protein
VFNGTSSLDPDGFIRPTHSPRQCGADGKQE